jgi:hypothetical protein
MSKIAFISGCDANYYPMLREWIDSIRRFPQSRSMDICILDAGLTEEQRSALRPLVRTIVNPDWPCALPASKIEGKEFLKACVCRPFLPEIFPGYDIYLWMDADTWVQNWTAVELFLIGAERRKITLTSQADRAYPRAARVKWLGRWPWKVRSFYFSNARKAYGFKTAKELLTRHVLLAGAFALHKDTPHWKRWQELVVQTMKKGKVFTAEQLSLGKMCHLEGYESEILPAWTHWLCEFKPLWDDTAHLFVEPYLPHQPLGILHLSGYDEMRLNRSLLTEFRALDGRTLRLSYRYPFFDGEA